MESTFAKMKYEDLSPEAVEVAKKLFMDALGTTIAGSSVPGSQALVNLVTDWGARKKVRSWFTEERSLLRTLRL